MPSYIEHAERIAEENTELRKLVKELIEILEVREETDSETAFNPTTIRCCREMTYDRLIEIFSRFKDITGEENERSSG